MRARLIAVACLAAAGAAAQAPCRVRVQTTQPVQARFGGVGFHNFHHLHPIDPVLDAQVFAKRWRELNPSFARVTDMWNLEPRWKEALARHALELKSTGTEIYLTTWNPRDTAPGEERAAYARTVVDNLEYLVRQRGATNVRWYCMTNELSLGGWGRLREDLPKFRDYHQKIYDELAARKLDIGLLASDASPVNRWDTIEWAALNMKEITAVYGGHHYFNDHTPGDLGFYDWFLGRLKWAAGVAAVREKGFILGEFGAKQYQGPPKNGKRWDACHWWDTPQEPLVAIQLADATLAALNAGVYALAYWTFADFPDDYNPMYANKWGVFKWSGADHSTRPHYYAYGLLTKFFRGPATVYAVTTNDPLVRAAALQHHGAGTWSVAVVNRRTARAALEISLEGAAVSAAFRKYVYDPKQPPSHPFGDLQPPAGKVAMRGGRLTDSVAAGTLAVYTTAYDERPPAVVKGLTVALAEGGATQLEWNANTEPDLCYYRIYRSLIRGFRPSRETQIGSTIATQFFDLPPEKTRRYYYAVLAVDQSGNASK